MADEAVGTAVMTVEKRTNDRIAVSRNMMGGLVELDEVSGKDSDERVNEDLDLG